MFANEGPFSFDKEFHNSSFYSKAKIVSQYVAMLHPAGNTDQYRQKTCKDCRFFGKTLRESACSEESHPKRGQGEALFANRVSGWDTTPKTVPSEPLFARIVPSREEKRFANRPLFETQTYLRKSSSIKRIRGSHSSKFDAREVPKKGYGLAKMAKMRYSACDEVGGCGGYDPIEDTERLIATCT